MCQGNIFEMQVLVLCLVLRAEMVMEFFKHLGTEKLIKKTILGSLLSAIQTTQ